MSGIREDGLIDLDCLDWNLTYMYVHTVQVSSVRGEKCVIEASISQYVNRATV